MPSVIIAGGGLAGLAVAAALGSSGFEVDLYEARGFLGGRATSFPLAPASDQSEVIDNCQHVLLRCCVNLLDFYQRLGVAHDITFHKEFCFIEPGGRVSILKAGGLPRPFHFAGSFLKMRCLSLGDKVSLGRALLALQRERLTRTDLDRITMLQWLHEKKQTKRAIDRFWAQVLVSAINEDLDKMAAIHGFQVFWLGFLASSTSYEMGIPNVPLGELYGSGAWQRFPGVRIHPRASLENFGTNGVTVRGERRTADYYVSTLPFEKLAAVAPELEAPQFEHSPITGIHLWFDRAITSLPHAVLLDRTVQWMFNKDGGTYLQLVVSASRSLLDKNRADVIALAVKELAEFFPEVSRATLVKAHVVKEVRATFSAVPGLETQRPGNRTRFPNVFLAGDWTRSGWPATMEGAVRSGYLAAEAVTAACGKPRSFLLPDIA
ncbi:MAG: hydroxysqualene dehydroxylase HpnE [Bryobacteraceae bacterium]